MTESREARRGSWIPYAAKQQAGNDVCVDDNKVICYIYIQIYLEVAIMNLFPQFKLMNRDDDF